MMRRSLSHWHRVVRDGHPEIAEPESEPRWFSRGKWVDVDHGHDGERESAGARCVVQCLARVLQPQLQSPSMPHAFPSIYLAGLHAKLVIGPRRLTSRLPHLERNVMFVRWHVPLSRQGFHNWPLHLQSTAQRGGMLGDVGMEVRMEARHGAAQDRQLSRRAAPSCAERTATRYTLNTESLLWTEDFAESLICETGSP